MIPISQATRLRQASAWQARLPLQFSVISQTAKSGVPARAVYDAALWARSRRRSNPWEVEFADARGPTDTGCHVVFVGMPEGHAIGIKRGHAVIAPAAGGTGLGPRAIGHYSFALPEVIQRVAGETSGITNTGEYGAARCRIPDGHVSVCVGSYSGHPAPQTVVAVCPVFLLSRCGRKIAAGNIELIPTNSSRPIRVIQDDRLICPQRFGAVSILVNDRRHDLVAKCIRGLRNSLLWHKQGPCVRECVNERVDCDQSIRSVVRANTQS
jgi:hypothetical protein